MSHECRTTYQQIVLFKTLSVTLPLEVFPNANLLLINLTNVHSRRLPRLSAYGPSLRTILPLRAGIGDEIQPEQVEPEYIEQHPVHSGIKPFAGQSHQPSMLCPLSYNAQIPRLAKDTEKAFSGPFKVSKVARDGKSHGRREVGDALVLEECQKVGVRGRIEDDLGELSIAEWSKMGGTNEASIGGVSRAFGKV